MIQRYKPHGINTLFASSDGQYILYAHYKKLQKRLIKYKQGFWGGACARLIIKNRKLEKEIKQLKANLKLTQDLRERDGETILQLQTELRKVDKLRFEWNNWFLN